MEVNDCEILLIDLHVLSLTLFDMLIKNEQNEYIRDWRLKGERVKIMYCCNKHEYPQRAEVC